MNRLSNYVTLLAAFAVIVLILLTPNPLRAESHTKSATQIRGAVYVPFGAYNAPQMWTHFSVKETRRDFHYAEEAHLNALRLWASYSYWKKHPGRFHRRLNQLLRVAHASGIRILISLFDNDGAPPTPQNMWTTNPRKAFDIQSPGRKIATGSPKEWAEPRRFVVWFMKHYRNDHRLLAIEVMNEPNNGTPKRPGTVPFAKAMFKTAKSLQGTVPLTVGTARVRVAEEFIPLGLNIIEIHDNFPRSAAALAQRIEAALAVGKKAGIPVWLTEWQRARIHGSGWRNHVIPASAKTPDYASLAATIHKFHIGNFFWSLMVKRAYLRGQRMSGTVDGLFWPDGAVTSDRDARAISGDPELTLPVRPVVLGSGQLSAFLRQQSDARPHGHSVKTAASVGGR